MWGSGPHGVLPGVLIAGFANLAVVALLAPAAGRLLRRRRADLPRAIAADYAGTALLALLAWRAAGRRPRAPRRACCRGAPRADVSGPPSRAT